MRIAIAGAWIRYGNRVTRNKIIDLIEKKGFEFDPTVSYLTDVLLCQDPHSGSKKLRDAKEKGTRIVSYDEFFNTFKEFHKQMKVEKAIKQIMEEDE